MGECACKRKFKRFAKKYGDNGEECEYKPSVLLKIIKFILQIPFGLLIGGIIIVVIVPILLYIIFCFMFGIDVKFNLSSITDYMNKKNKE